MIVGSLEIQLRADLARLSRDMSGARQIVSDTSASMASAANAAKAALAGMAAGLGGRELIRITDEYTKYTAQLKLATGSEREYAQARSDARRIANGAQQDLGATGMLYAKIANGTRELGVAQSRVADITEVVNLALKVSGAAASESASAQLQLSQAFASGALRGEEFNAVNEAAPRLMLALADGIGVPVGALKKMAENGLITSQIMADVLPKSLEKLREESKQVQTISGAFTVLRNEVMEFVGTQANASGAVSVLVSGINMLSNNLGLLAGVITTLGVSKLVTMLSGWGMETYRQVVANNTLRTSTLAAAVTSTEAAATTAAAKLAEAQANVRTSASSAALATARVVELRTAVLSAEGAVALAIATNGLIPAQARAIALSEAHALALAQEAAAAGVNTTASAANAAALTAQAAATGLAARTMGVLRGAMMFMGGPIGAVVTLLGLAATAWMVWRDKAKDANDKVVKSTVESTNEMIARLDKQIEKLKERNKLQGDADANPNIRKLGEISDADKAGLLRAKEDMDAAINGTGRFEGRSERGRQLAITNLTEAYETALHRVKEAQDEVKNSQDLAFNKKNAEWLGQNGTAAQREAYELEKLRKEYGRVTPEMEKWVKAKVADKGAAKEVRQEETAYTNLITSIREKITANGQELAAGEDLSESQKMQIAFDQQLATGKLKLSDGHKQVTQGLLGELAASEELLKIRAGEKSATTWMQQSAQARNESAAALAAEYALYGKGADARDVAMVAVKAEADLEKYLSEERRKGLIISEEYEAQMRAEKEMRVEVEQATLAQTKALGYATQLAKENKQFAAESISDPRAREQAILQIDADVWRERIRIAGEGTDAQKVLQQEFDTWYANRLKGVATNVNLTQATQLLEIMSALDESARSAAQGMADSFGRVGKAIGGLTTALSGLGKTQAAIAAQLASATKAAGGDQVKLAAATTEASRQSAQAQIQSYGDMAAAGKGFFDENSRGYAAMEAAEKTFRAFEVALAIKTMLEKSGILQAFTSLFVAGKAAETSATVASVGPDVAASVVKGQAAAAAGVAGQAQGDPYSAWARMAAMAAVMAGLGFAVGGIGGKKDTTAVDRQKATGTGSVFGNADAKSESIAKAIELSAANSNIELNYTAGMLRSLRAIESSVSGLGGILAQNGVSGAAPGKTYGAAEQFMNTTVGQLVLGGPLIALADKLLGGFIGKVTGKIAGAIFGGKTQALDVGVMTNKATVASALGDGLNVQSYADMKKDGGWFHSDKSWTDAQSIGAEANQQLSQVIGNMAAAVGEAGKLLGLGGDAFTQRLNGFVVDIGKISTKDLKADEIQKQLEAAFSKVGDDMARWAVGGLTQFQKVGEGALETLVRVAADYANLDSVLASVGKTFGATGLASINARESLIDLAGGIDELASKTAGFAENFLSEAERLAPVQKYVAEQLASLGLAGLRSRDSFKQYVLGLDLTSEAQRQQYVALMDLQDAFAKVYPEIEAATLSVADAKSALVDAYNAEVDAIGATVDRMASFASSLRSVRDSALLGNLSPLSPQQKYAEAKSQYEAVLSAARGGDEGAQSNYQSAFTSFLEASRTVFASSSQYQADFAYAQAATEEAARWAELEADVGRAQLDVLKSQVSGIIEVNKSVLSVRDALLQYQAVMGGNTMPLTAVAPPVNTPIPYSSYGTSNTEALVAEVKALNARIDAQTKVIEAQTGKLTVAAYDSADDSADRITRSLKAASYGDNRVAPE